MKLIDSERSDRGHLVRYYWDDADSRLHIRTTYDSSDVIKANKAQQILSLDTRFGGEMMHHVAEIPDGIVVKWLAEGIDVLSTDPDMKKRVRRKLDDPDYRYLKSTVRKLSRRTIGT